MLNDKRLMNWASTVDRQISRKLYDKPNPPNTFLLTVAKISIVSFIQMLKFDVKYVFNKVFITAKGVFITCIRYFFRLKNLTKTIAQFFSENYESRCCPILKENVFLTKLCKILEPVTEPANQPADSKKTKTELEGIFLEIYYP